MFAACVSFLAIQKGTQLTLLYNANKSRATTTVGSVVYARRSTKVTHIEKSHFEHIFHEARIAGKLVQLRVAFFLC
jgi:hypothetical protein